MADAGARRHHPEVVEGALAPLQEGVALEVALVFAVDVHLEGARVAELVDHHRMVDHQVDRVERIDLLRITSQRLDAVTHRRKVDHRRDAGEVLHEHARRAIGDLARVPAALAGPFREGADVVDADGLAVLEAEHVLQDHLERGRKPAEIAESRGLRGGDRVVGVGLVAHLQIASGLGGVGSCEDGHGAPGLIASMTRNQRCYAGNRSLSQGLRDKKNTTAYIFSHPAPAPPLPTVGAIS